MLTGHFKFLFPCLTLLSAPALADFLPPNNLHLEDNLLRDANVKEDDFNTVIDQVEALYGPIIKDTQKANLKVSRLWKNNTVNASAMQLGQTWTVNMYGGLARRHEVTLDAFTLVLCHELGHHVAGYPFTTHWASNEGQSDYFATQSCGKLLWRSQRSKNSTAREQIAAIPKADCDAIWKNEEEQNLCYRLMLASKSLADLAGSIGANKVNWETPDAKVVNKTYNGHPQGQCRLDTMKAGALCAADFDSTLIPGKDLGSKRNSAEAEMVSAKHTCTEYMQYELGFRPRCWFRPAL
jgi:hypothetical protein